MTSQQLHHLKRIDSWNQCCNCKKNILNFLNRQNKYHGAAHYLQSRSSNPQFFKQHPNNIQNKIKKGLTCPNTYHGTFFGKAKVVWWMLSLGIYKAKNPRGRRPQGLLALEPPKGQHSPCHPQGVSKEYHSL